MPRRGCARSCFKLWKHCRAFLLLLLLFLRLLPLLYQCCTNVVSMLLQKSPSTQRTRSFLSFLSFFRHLTHNTTQMIVDWMSGWQWIALISTRTADRLKAADRRKNRLASTHKQADSSRAISHLVCLLLYRWHLVLPRMIKQCFSFVA